MHSLNFSKQYLEQFYSVRNGKILLDDSRIALNSVICAEEPLNVRGRYSEVATVDEVNTLLLIPVVRYGRHDNLKIVPLW